MRLALIGNPVKHSLSPKLYREILGDQLEVYDLLEYENASLIPSLEELDRKYSGINITSPYKQHFTNGITITSPLVRSLNAINTLSFTSEGVFGTNTDVVAVEEVLQKYKERYSHLHIILLGNGVMAQMTELLAHKLSIQIKKVFRSKDLDISKTDLIAYRNPACQNLVINACSRDFIFNGIISKEDIFWDYNYSFPPHQETLPSRVKIYEDGQEILQLQALAAVKFWKETNPKLKC